MDVRLPDGTVVRGVPDNITKAELVAKLRANGMTVPDEWAGAAPQQAPQQPQSGGVMQQLGNLAAGAVRGAGSIGATLMAPFDYAQQGLERLAGAPARAQSINAQRRAGITGGLQSLGADPESMAFQAGQIGGEVAGTLGVGGALGNVAMRAPGAAALMQAPAATGAAARLGAGAGRVAGGAITGGLSAGLVNPEDAGTGALIGGALPVVGGAARLGAAGAREFLGGTTGVGGNAITRAFQAGQKGGQAADDFVSNMRGRAPMEDVLSAAKSNLAAMRQARQAAYRSGMADVSKDQAVLSLDGVRKAVADAADSLSFKGVAKDPKAAKAVDEARKEIQRWSAKPPDQFHTPEGLDALKQRIGAILESIPMEQKNARRAVQGVYDATKQEITKQAPGYAKVMEDYTEATRLIGEIEKTFSQGGKASADTAMRKLQALMRNNASTNYGYRDTLAQKMIEQGGNDFMPALAGQAMSAWMPRGIQRATAGGGAATMGLLGQPVAAGGLAAMSSPRLIGEGAYLAGRLSNPLERLLDPASRAAPVIGAGMLGNRE